MKIEKAKIKLNFLDGILGSMPADPAIYTKFVAAKAPAGWLSNEEILNAEELAATKEADFDADRNVTVFPQDETGIFLYNYHVKGFLKEAGNVLKDQVKIKNLRSKLDNYVFVNPRKIYLTRPGGEIVAEEDDILERPLRGQTARGERITLLASERVLPPAQIVFTVELIEHKEVTLDTIRAILDYGKYKGLGQWRNGGWGRFEWEELD